MWVEERYYILGRICCSNKVKPKQLWSSKGQILRHYNMFRTCAVKRLSADLISEGE